MEHPGPGVAEVQPLTGPSNAHVGETTFLLQFVGIPQGPHVREHAVLHADNEHDRILEALGGMHGHQDDLTVVEAILSVRNVVGVGHQADLFKKLGYIVELAGHTHQFSKVLEPSVGLDRMLGLQLIQVAGPGQCRLEDSRRPVADETDEAPVQIQERADSRNRTARDAGLGAPAERLHEPAPGGFSESIHPTDRGVAHTPLWNVQHALGSHLVGGVGGQLEIRHGISHLAPVIEAGTANNLVRNPAAD